MKIAALRSLILLAFLLPSVALAHTGVGDTHGFVHGFTHPVGGLDHVLAMMAAGLLAAHFGGRALWLVPASFVALMAVGGALGFADARLPFVEIGIALSVIVLGLMVAFRTQMPILTAASLAGFFAIFHGQAHGAELPEGASAFSYALGFMLATAALHAAGIALAIALGRLAGFGVRLAQAGGGAMAITGLLLLSRAAIS